MLDYELTVMGTMMKTMIDTHTYVYIYIYTHTHTHTHTHIYIYIYACVCVWMCGKSSFQRTQCMSYSSKFLRLSLVIFIAESIQNYYLNSTLISTMFKQIPKRFSWKFFVGSRVWHETPEVGQMAHKPRRCKYTNKDEEKTSNTLRDKYNMCD